MTSSPRRLVAVPIAVVVLGVALAGCGTATAPPPEKAPTDAVTVSVTDCGSQWTPTAAGPQTLVLHNGDSRPGEVRVVGVDDVHRRQVFAEVEPFGPGTDVTVHLRLAAGSYALQCLMEDEPSITGPAVQVTGTATGGPGVVPVDESQLIHATQQYSRWVLGRLPALVTRVRALRGDLAAHRTAAARSDWVAAHAGYERLGAAYEAFGELDDQINGLRPSGGTEQWTGFHALERALWHGASYAETSRLAAGLGRDIAALHDQLASTQLDPLTMSIRAHEISENLLQTTLTGQDDLGSHSALATVGAGLAGTHVVLGLLHHLLASRYDQTGGLTRELAHVRRLVAHLAGTSLGHTAVGAWPRAQRERLDAAVSHLCERLAPVAAVLEPRRSS